jgi:hypothetical protein
MAAKNENEKRWRQKSAASAAKAKWRKSKAAKASVEKKEKRQWHIEGERNVSAEKRENWRES